MNVFDVLLNADYDLEIRGGDFVIGESTEQHQALLLYTNKGEWRQAPEVGIGIVEMLLDDASGVGIASEIQQQLELDGQQIMALRLSPQGALHLEGYYKDTDE
ncbi:oxidase [Hymenobacter glacieicola]|uniref:Oxidase n=1 Tax=Hymenobacter glacieicola TaxID=1562124 RepID=A0ABQ1WKB7_9BACT|nr:oxidase [Hymenobacter glacieicola]GGG33438.1 hypothetical protein GCM10011378_07400 [Hymenobacter glacieicola]